MRKQTSSFELNKWQRIFDSVKTGSCKISESGGIASASINEFLQRSGIKRSWGYLSEESFNYDGTKEKVLEFSTAGELPRFFKSNKKYPARITGFSENCITIEFTSKKDFFITLDSSVILAIPTLDYEVYLIPAKVYSIRLTGRENLVYGFLFDEKASEFMLAA